uniref:Fructose-bisphosphate aldolase n=1 Tax=Gymnochlora stellata TaxID=67809 RepID=B5A4I1_GYMST|nr:plastid targeted class I fructose-1,6-bisphosphate aldolase [Gymnochlora stellata]
MYQAIGQENSNKKTLTWGLISSVIANVALVAAVCFVASSNADVGAVAAVRPAPMSYAPIRKVALREVQSYGIKNRALFRRNAAEASLQLSGYVPYPDTTGASLTSLPGKQEPSPYSAELRTTAAAIAADGKGILACDESTMTIGKRLEQIGVPNEEKYRQQWLELLFRTPNMNDAISSAILFEETLFPNAAYGTPFVDIMKANNFIPGIKVDTGVRATFKDGETITEGLEGLAERAQKYYKQGARFAKWRAVLRIDPSGAPSMEAIEANARSLAHYGKICQMNGLVPIIEPEVLMDGEHGIEVQAWVTEKVQAATMKALSDVNIEWEGMLLKPNMILPGTDSGKTASPEEVAKYTVEGLKRTLPAAVPGITFLSGGQSEEEATRNLDAMNKLFPDAPWKLSFSFGRALQASVLKAWDGKEENIEGAQKLFYALSKANGEAALGKFEGAHPATTGSLYEKNYVY